MQAIENYTTQVTYVLLDFVNCLCWLHILSGVVAGVLRFLFNQKEQLNVSGYSLGLKYQFPCLERVSDRMDCPLSKRVMANIYLQ